MPLKLGSPVLATELAGIEAHNEEVSPLSTQVCRVPSMLVRYPIISNNSSNPSLIGTQRYSQRSKVISLLIQAPANFDDAMMTEGTLSSP